MKYKDKVVWITGASSGIGEHLAYAFAQQGAKLVLSSRNRKELERVKSSCSGNTPILILPLDVQEFSSFPAAVDKVIEKFGFVNILINNAGISQRELAKNTDLKVDRKIMDINYMGTIGLTKALLPHFLHQQFGQIVSISSVMGKMGVPYRSAYAASKHALHGFFDALRGELARDNIKVTLICPGYVTTNVTINALKGDGSKNNQMAESTRKGMDPGLFAQKALRAIHREKKEIIISGAYERLGVYIRKFLPFLFHRSVANMKPN